jgi:DNA repair exonuclease SbcCD nuclease subunit
VFGKGRVEEASVYIGDRHAATILGRSWHGRSRVDVGEFALESSDDFRIALTNGELDEDAAAASQIQYWALGGSMSRKMLIETPHQIAHYPGAPQGFTPDATDTHGCVLVVVDDNRQMQARALPTDAVRWRVAPEKGGRAELLRVMRERFRQIAAEAADRVSLLEWHVASSYRMAAALRHGEWASQLQRELNQHAGAAPLWNVSVEPVTVEQLPGHWYEEDTILGDFLRAVRSFEGVEQTMRLHEFVGQRHLDASLHDLLLVSDAEREQMLCDVALLGAELLRGEAA